MDEFAQHAHHLTWWTSRPILLATRSSPILLASAGKKPELQLGLFCFWGCVFCCLVGLLTLLNLPVRVHKLWTRCRNLHPYSRNKCPCLRNGNLNLSTDTPNTEIGHRTEVAEEKLLGYLDT